MVTMKYSHELQKEIRSISGWYMIHKDVRIEHKNRTFLCLVGNGVVESLCCGAGGYFFAVVPGSIARWKSETDTQGSLVSEVMPVTDKGLKAELRDIISQREGVSQVQFW